MSRFQILKAKARSLTFRELAAESILRGRRRIAHAYHAAVDSPEAAYPSIANLQKALANGSLDQTTALIKSGEGPRLTAGLADLEPTIEAIRTVAPGSLDELIREADDVLAHKVTLFEKTFDLGNEIDWSRDPTTGARWPKVHFTKTPIRIGGGSDVKFVWELNRFHHLVTLGQAYAITRDDRYTEQFLAQASSWYRDNPPGFGVNWTVAMEVAIRSINLVAAFDLFRESPLIDREAISLVLRMLLTHGRFIRRNLEFSYSTTSNHYLSDLIGLAVIGMAAPDFTESKRWLDFSVPRLLAEMDKQILPDGVDYELSTSYHRLVLESFVLLFSLSWRCALEIPPRYWDKLRGMFTFVRCYLKPDGTAPLIGDSDDGRVIRFQPRAAVDHSYLMSIAGILLGDPSYKTEKTDPEAVWWFGKRAIEPAGASQYNSDGPVSQGFGNSQIFIQRSGDLYAIVDCGDNGIGGRGSHAHSDALAFELFAYGRTLIRDPGTFIYTGNPEWRNRFRSTAYHNTVLLDGKDISELSEQALFSLGANVKPKVLRWETGPERDVLEASHDGYLRLASPVLIRRKVVFKKTAGYWIIEDSFDLGSGRTSAINDKADHLFEICFNFDTGLNVTVGQDSRTLAESNSASVAIVPMSGRPFEAKVVDRWVSLSYGTKTPSFGIIYSLHSSAGFSNTFLVVPYPAGGESLVDRAVADFQSKKP